MKAMINPNEAQMIGRHVARISTLGQAIEKAQKAGNEQKVNSLNAELSRRKAAVQKFKEALDNI